MAQVPCVADRGLMTSTLHIENTVHDYDTWKHSFDKFDRFRSDGGVRRHRVSRKVDDPHEVVVDLDFDTMEQAAGFAQRLQKVWATPQSQAELANHASAVVHEVLEEHQHS